MSGEGQREADEGKELKGKDQRGREREKGVEGRMWDLEGPQSLGVWGRQEEDACCRTK